MHWIYVRLKIVLKNTEIDVCCSVLLVNMVNMDVDHME